MSPQAPGVERFFQVALVHAVQLEGLPGRDVQRTVRMRVGETRQCRHERRRGVAARVFVRTMNE